MRRILIVEDEKPISSILQYGFKKEGFEVRCALTGSEALELFRGAYASLEKKLFASISDERREACMQTLAEMEANLERFL